MPHPDTKESGVAAAKIDSSSACARNDPVRTGPPAAVLNVSQAWDPRAGTVARPAPCLPRPPCPPSPA